MGNKANLKTLWVMMVLLLGLGCAIAAGDVTYVDADAALGGDGLSWGTALKYLQDGLALAAIIPDFNELWVAEGTYKPDEAEYVSVTLSDPCATFQLINGVAVYGGFAGGETNLNQRDWQTNETILSGDLDGNDVEVSEPCDLLTEPTRAENSYHVVNGSNTDVNTILNGFTITAGNANGSGFQLCGGGALQQWR